jgi:hypothetical protein
VNLYLFPPGVYFLCLPAGLCYAAGLHLIEPRRPGRVRPDGDPRDHVSDFPAAFAEVLLRALRRRPSARYQTAAGFAADLWRVVETSIFPSNASRTRFGTLRRPPACPGGPRSCSTCEGWRPLLAVAAVLLGDTARAGRRGRR